ncbi:MAG TPA: hypothetical protein VKV15_05870 [Bryobacteraceae bacterium]|nr:hypothetical protein [Bryobacteraceae bacterium]
MISTILIFGTSMMLFAYWFRYTCLLILSAKTTRDFAADVAAANSLGCLLIRDQLRLGAVIGELDLLSKTLHRDYQVVTYLLQHAAVSDQNGSGLEQRMLRIDYRLMRLCYSVLAPFSPRHARQALEEMTQIVCHFANVMGERATAGACA